ncbi:MAG: aminoacyl-tRNA hydrolase [Clostridiales Family XIII bacterium]|jgi:PTH1 family peptidyl-tRNA hydrolase|nr:aminoacyl-tRNA hydrolase [Clostridiales Family XIII bacterium]
MIFVIGLGNPGREYENTRHNLGFITIDRLAERHDIKVSKLKHKALTGTGMISGSKAMLVKPQTYMNLSGETVRSLIHYYGARPEDIIIIYDDVDIPTGSLRIRKKGSAGSHNGMKSVIYHIGDDSFARYRIGIGKQDRGRQPLRDYVLGGFSPDDTVPLRDAVDRCARAIEEQIANGVDAAMQKYNG